MSLYSFILFYLFSYIKDWLYVAEMACGSWKAMPSLSDETRSAFPMGIWLRPRDSGAPISRPRKMKTSDIVCLQCKAGYRKLNACVQIGQSMIMNEMTITEPG